MKLIGAPQTILALQELPRRVHYKHEKIAMSAAGGVVRDEAAGRVRRQTGLLARSLGVKVPKPKKNSVEPLKVIIGPRRRFAAIRSFRLLSSGRLSSRFKQLQLKRGRKIATTLRRATQYAHLIEKGHRNVKGGALNKGGRVVGQVPAHPFLQPALVASGERAISAYQRKIKQGIEQEAFGLSKQAFEGA